jgi:hypothetical protein
MHRYHFTADSAYMGLHLRPSVLKREGPRRVPA